MDFWYIILIALLLFAVLFIIYMIWLNVTARKQGLPFVLNPFTSVTGARRYSNTTQRTGGLFGWINDKIREYRYKRNRSAAGAYEGQSLGGFNSGRQGARVRGLDPDDAWDARVGAEADAGYYEEDIDLDRDTSYKAGGDLEGGRGRHMSREHEGPMSGGNQAGLDQRYRQEMGIPTPQKDGAESSRNPFEDSKTQSSNPFDDANAASPLPPPPGEGSKKEHKKGQESLGLGLSKEDRRSSFKEDVA